MLKLNSMRSTPPFLCIHYALLLILCPTKSCTLWSPEKIIFTDCDYDFLEKISPCTLHMLQISMFIAPHHPFLLGKLTISQLEQLTPIGLDFHLMSFFLWQTEHESYSCTTQSSLAAKTCNTQVKITYPPV
jgi:hypothetical protein